VVSRLFFALERKKNFLVMMSRAKTDLFIKNLKRLFCIFFKEKIKFPLKLGMKRLLIGKKSIDHFFKNQNCKI